MTIGNKIVCLSYVQLNELIPSYYKDRYWIKSIDESENVTYKQITWMELTNNRAYRLLNGKTPVKNGLSHVKIDMTELDEIALNNDGYHLILDEQ